MTILLPIAIRNGTFVHISEVDRGLDCDSVCPECGMPLVAKKGFIRTHHFAHASTSHPPGCGGEIESAIHQYAKKIIAEAGYLEVPAFEVTLPPPDLDMKAEIPAHRKSFIRVEVEESMVFGRRRVDVVGYTPEGRLLIEICVTNRVRGTKLREVKAASEAMLEIKVSEDALFSKASEGIGSLQHTILDSVDHKTWLFHPEGEEIRARLERQASDRRANSPWIQPRERSTVVTPQVENTYSPNRGGHLPSRTGLSEENYVRLLCEFLTDARYNEHTRQRVISALRLSGNITDRDIEIAIKLGIWVRTSDLSSG